MFIVKDGLGKAYNLDMNSLLTATVRELAALKGSDSDTALETLRDFSFDRLSATSAAGKQVLKALEKAGTTGPAIKDLLNSSLGQLLLEGSANAPDFKLRKLSGAGGRTATYDIEAGNEAGTTAGTVTLSFSAEAGAKASIKVLHQSSAPKEPVLTIPVSDALLQLGLAAHADVEGSFKVPFNGGSGTGAAGAAAAVEIDGFWQDSGDTSILNALMNHGGNLGSPWDLDWVSKNLAKVDALGESRGLRRISLRTSGDLHLTGSVSAGYSWAYTNNIFASSEDLNASLKATASLSVGWKRNGSFRLTVERTPGDDLLTVSVGRTDGNMTSFGAALSADLTITGLGQMAQPIADRLFPDASSLRASLQRWTAPGKALVDHLFKTIGNNDEAISALANLLVGRESAEDTQTVVRSLLLEVIQEQVDTYLPFWKQLDAQDKLEAQLSQALLDRFGIEGKVADTLKNGLVSWLGPGIKALSDELSAAMNAVAEAGGETLKELLEAFEKIGENVDAIINAIDKKTDALLGNL